MGDRAGQFNMPHAVATNFRKSDFDATLFANYTAMLQAFIFAAKTFVILNRAEDLGAEQSITLWLERTVVNCFRFLHLTE